MTAYRLRAECSDDVVRLMNALRASGVHTDMRVMKDVALPDVTATFKCDLSLDALRGIIATIDDGHVMHETVERAERYTGERRSA